MTARTKNPQVRVTRRFDATAERVFDAWLDPSMAVKWLFKSVEAEAVRAEIDPRVGGRFTVVAERADGDVTHVGEYLVIERPTRLVFTFAVPQFSPEYDRVSVHIRRLDEGCELTLVNEMSPAIFAEWGAKTQEGWAQLLSGLDAALSGVSGAMSSPEHRVVIDLHLPVPPAEVYAAWTKVDALRRWFGDNVQADARVGGRYRAENRDGDTVYVHEGAYLVLERDRLVRMSFRVPNAPQSGRNFSNETIEARFEPAGVGTRLRFTNGWNGDALGADDEAAVRAAWLEWLGQLAQTFQAKGDLQ